MSCLSNVPVILATAVTIPHKKQVKEKGLVGHKVTGIHIPLGESWEEDLVREREAVPGYHQTFCSVGAGGTPPPKGFTIYYKLMPKCPDICPCRGSFPSDHNISKL